MEGTVVEERTDNLGPWGTYPHALSPEHRALLDASGIKPHVAERRGYRTSRNKTELTKLKFGPSQALHPALIVPLWNTLGGPTGYQVRPDEPRIDNDGRTIRYETPRKARMVLDVHPDARGPLGDPKCPLIVTEGVRKADAAWSRLEVPAVALMGVSCWRGTNANGGLAALVDWEDVVLNREVLVVFDSDAMHKLPVAIECARLGAFLVRRHAQVAYVRLPDGAHGSKVGLDDYLATGARLADLRALSSPNPPEGPITVNAEPEDDYIDVPGESGARLLDELAGFFGRYLVLKAPEIGDTLALWSLHTWSLKAFAITPRLSVTSPEKRSGKSRVVEAMSCVCARPEMVILPSAAAIFRLTEATCPTWLLDEVDNLLAASEEARAALLAVVNAGYRKGATIPRVEKVGDAFVVSRFRIFSAVAMAGLGQLPDTTADRAIPIPMERKLVTEATAHFHIERTFAETAALRRRCAAWAKRHHDELVTADPAIPHVLDDRAAECWGPLFAIAETADGDWPDRARTAAVALSGPEREKTESIGVRLLVDLRTIFGAGTRMPTQDILRDLYRLEESPWGDYSSGRPLSARQLASLLRPFGIRPSDYDFNGVTRKGYDVSDGLAEAWQRYCAQPPPFHMGKKGKTADQGSCPSCPSCPSEDGEENSSSPPTPDNHDPLHWDDEGGVDI
jgi:hypothetical protein